jgi:tetratricopeptide (TPR) repeat protein
MRSFSISLLLLAALAVALAAPAPVAAQTAGVRGQVVDENGEPMKGVKITFEFLGETRGKREWTQDSDKSGGFIRVGLPSGPYKIHFDAEGYRPYSVDIYLSLGGFSEIPEPIQMEPLPQGVQLTAEQRAEMARMAADEEARKRAEEAAAEAQKLGATYSKAIEAIKVQDWDEAEKLLKQFLEERPDTPQAHFNLGFIDLQRGQLDEAAAEYQKVTELQPDQSDAFIALAAVYEQQGKMTEAFEVLQEASPRFEQDATFQTALGAIAMNTGNEKLAEEAFARAVELDPTQVEVQFHLATLALNRGQSDDAVAHLEAYVASAPPGAPNLEVATALLDALKKQQ